MNRWLVLYRSRFGDPAPLIRGRLSTRVKDAARGADSLGVTATGQVRMRVLAIAGGLAALAVALFFFMMTRAQPPAVDTSGSLAAERAAVTPKPASPAAVKPDPAAKPKAAPADKPVIEPKAPPKQVAAPAPTHGLPALVGRALADHQLVLVSLYVPGSRVDKLAADEAEAGAKALGIGFVRLNVLEEASSAPLVEKLGVLQNPSMLVFDRQGALRVRLQGFVDRQTVAQAVLSASKAQS